MHTFTRKIGLLLLLFTSPAFALDDPGQDLPFLGRYPGSVIDHYKTVHYDEIVIPLGPLGKTGLARSETVEGQITYIRYKVPEDRSPLEFIRNYQQALQRAGFRILWQCADHGCIRKGAPLNTPIWRGAPTGYTGGVENFYFNDGRMLTAEHRVSNGVRTLVFINDNTEFGHSQVASVYAVQSKPMQSGMVSSDAEQMSRENMASALVQQGRFAMHLPFDFNQETLRPDAQPTLIALSRLMRQHPSLRVRLEGHTDPVGTVAYNQKLSLHRALTVKSVLAAQGIADQRIEVIGYGATRPVANSDSEEGRAQNRRVEVVNLTPGALAGRQSANIVTANVHHDNTSQTASSSRANTPGAELVNTTVDTVRSETNHQIQQGVRNLVQGILGN